MITWDDFAKIDIRAGTIVRYEAFEDAKRPALKLWIDLGALGVRSSSAQITFHYKAENILGKQVVCVVNFPPKQIGKFISEVLITGFPDQQDNVVLCSVDKQVPNGARLF